MGPQDLAPRIHLRLQHGQLEIQLAAPTLVQVSLKGIHALVDLPVLAQQLGRVLPVLELGHLLREDGEDVLLLDGVVGGEVGAELEPRGEELLDAEVLGPFVLLAGAVEEVPGLAEVVVLWLGLGSVTIVL